MQLILVSFKVNNPCKKKLLLKVDKWTQDYNHTNNLLIPYSVVYKNSTPKLHRALILSQKNRASNSVINLYLYFQNLKRALLITN